MPGAASSISGIERMERWDFGKYGLKRSAKQTWLQSVKMVGENYNDWE